MNDSIWQKIRGAMQLRRALNLVWASARNWTIASLVIMIFQALLPLVVLYLIKLLVDAVAAGIVAPDKTAFLREVIFLVIITGLVTLLTAICRAAAEIIQEHQGHLVTDHVTDTIHGQSAEIDLAYYETSEYHDTFYRAQQEAPYRPTQIVNGLTIIAQNSISLLALGGLLFYLHWGVALILFVTVIPGIIVKIRHTDRLYDWQIRRTETERRTYDYHWMLTGMVYAKELRLFDLGNLFRERYRNLRNLLRSERLELAKTRSIFDLAAQAGAILALFAMLIYIASQTLQGVLTLGDMVMYFQAFQRAQTNLQGILTGLAGLYEDNLFLKHFYGFLDLKPQVNEPLKPVSVPRPMRKGISCDQVTFCYPGTDREILKEIDFIIRPGEVVAIVGDNGAGKSTLAKLLCRLYDPQKGQIVLDDINYRSFNSRDLRREITMIFQDYIQYPFTARENIWIGDTLLDPNDKRIETAARQAGADEVISRLTDGYDTMLGKRFKKGEEISIGEWQKIALSRAFLRDAQLVILDEPTSAMSVRAEYELFNSFRNLLNGRSALLISHRFSTVRMADRICVLEEGKIVEAGSHEELIRLGKRYARLYNLQAQYFR